MSKMCPKLRSNKCFNCFKDGHMSKKCPKPKVKKCFNCLETGHQSKACPAPKVTKCFNCQEEGHMSSECKVEVAADQIEGGTVQKVEAMEVTEKKVETVEGVQA
jgi:hypothetical protein